MGLGRLLHARSTNITATDTISGMSQTYTITDNIVPNWASGSYRGGMSIPGAYRAATLLSGLIGQAPWDAFRQPIGQPEVKIEPTPPLLDQMNPPETRLTSFRSLAMDLIWHGNGIAVIAARSPLGWPTAAIPVPAWAVGVRRVTKWIDSPLPVGELEYQVGEMRLGSQDVIHIKGPVEPGGVRGFGVLENHLNTLDLAQSLDRQARSVSQHGVPTGVLTSSNPDLTDNEAADLKANWLRNQQDRTVAVLNPSTTFTPLAWNPEQMQLVEARRMSKADLELVFGLPVGWLGGMTSARQYSNIEQDAVQLLKFSLGDHLAQFEQTFTLALPRGTVARANLDFLLRTDTLSRYQAHAIALSSGFLDVDEVRDLEHRPPLPEDSGDEAARALKVAEVVRFLQLGVDKLLTADEARKIANDAGAGLTGSMPEPTPASVPPGLVPFVPPAPTPAMNGNGGSHASNQGQ
jgi:HK97 family phage portal protein